MPASCARRTRPTMSGACSNSSNIRRSRPSGSSGRPSVVVSAPARRRSKSGTSISPRSSACTGFSRASARRRRPEPLAHQRARTARRRPRRPRPTLRIAAPRSSVRTPPQSTTSPRSRRRGDRQAPLPRARAQQRRHPGVERREERVVGRAGEPAVVRRLEQDRQLPDRQRDEPARGRRDRAPSRSPSGRTSSVAPREAAAPARPGRRAAPSRPAPARTRAGSRGRPAGRRRWPSPSRRQRPPAGAPGHRRRRRSRCPA